VSQILPVITDLFQAPSPALVLLQQPEVHLHPSAQAALGSLLCRLAGPDRQIVVETHSDYIADRVRLDIRDERSNLTPDDVSVLFFEPGNLDVQIHALRFDRLGNVQGAPPGYRQFFLEEASRQLDLEADAG